VQFRGDDEHVVENMTGNKAVMELYFVNVLPSGLVIWKGSGEMEDLNGSD
jgi:hypothetical protein